jgi:hypothetical protein
MSYSTAGLYTVTFQFHKQAPTNNIVKLSYKFPSTAFYDSKRIIIIGSNLNLAGALFGLLALSTNHISFVSVLLLIPLSLSFM